MTDLRATIKGVKTLSKDGGMSEREYRFIADEILSRAPCNVLVFGTGYDSALWMQCNTGGQTVFLEDCEKWIKEAKTKNSTIDTVQVKYVTRLQDTAVDTVEAPKQLVLPKRVVEMDWDIIIVDAPRGHKSNSPGRSQSIYMASALSHENCTVFVHDVDRDGEQRFCRHWLGEPPLVTKRLARYGKSSLYTGFRVMRLRLSLQTQAWRRGIRRMWTRPTRRTV